MEVAFVILNYNTYQETVECIQSIEKKLDTQDYRIVIVDNNSKDDSADKLCSFIIGKNKIEILYTEKNLGFAKGNNVGIRYVNEHYHPKFLVVLNSDTELIQNDLIYKLNREFENSKFSLLGPLILTADGRCDNSPHFPPSKAYVQKELKTFQKERKIIKYGLYGVYCGLKFFKKMFIQKVLRKSFPSHRNMEFQQYKQQVVVQGCFMVFSYKAFEYIDGFDEKTFLYYEEPILYLELIKNGLTIVYNPEICIYHKDGHAINTIQRKTKDKLLFINQCYQNSAKVLLDLLND